MDHKTLAGRAQRAVLVVLVAAVKLVSFGSVDLASKNLDKGAMVRIWGFLLPFLLSQEKTEIQVPVAITLPHWRQIIRPSWLFRPVSYVLGLTGSLGGLLLLYALAVALGIAGSAAPFLSFGFLQSATDFYLELVASGPVMLELLLGVLLFFAFCRYIHDKLELRLGGWMNGPAVEEQERGLTIAVPLVGGKVLAVVPEWLRTWALIGVIGFGTWLVNQFALMVNDYNGIFMDAVTQKDQAAFTQVLVDFGVVLAIYTLVGPVYAQVKKILMLEWMKFTTRDLLRRWIGGGRQYALSLLGNLDNPNQRIEESVRIMCAGVMSFLFDIMDSVITLYLFTGRLWDIEKKLNLSYTFFGHTFVFDHLLLYTFLIYAIFGTNAAALVGRALIPLRAWQSRLMSDFRVSTVFVEKQAEAIAAYRGEAREYGKAWERYTKALGVTRAVYSWQRNLAFFTGAYNRVASFVPYVVLAPFFFGGKITFGMISKASDACGNILSALSVIVSQFDSISETLASVTRCGELKEALVDIEAEAAGKERPRIAYHQGGTQSRQLLVVNDMTLFTPFGRQLIVHRLNLELTRGDRVMIVGPSGSGKTSILRSIERLLHWDWGTGEIRMASGARTIALSQLAYVLYEEPLRNQLLYPAGETSDSELIAILDQVNLGGWLRDKLTDQLLSRSIPNFAQLTMELQKQELEAARAKWEHLPVGEQQRQLLDATLNWELSMSGGERQRLMVGRALANKVDLIIADEPTSGLDDENTVALYDRLSGAGLSMLTVTHNRVLLPYHHRVLQLKGDGKGGWQEVPASQLKW